MISRRLFFAAPLLVPGMAVTATLPKVPGWSDVTLSEDGWADINFNYREDWKPKAVLIKELRSKGYLIRTHFAHISWGSPCRTLLFISDAAVLWDGGGYLVLKDRGNRDWKITFEMQEIHHLWAAGQILKARERRVAALVKRGSLKV